MYVKNVFLSTYIHIHIHSLWYLHQFPAECFNFEFYFHLFFPKAFNLKHTAINFPHGTNACKNCVKRQKLKKIFFKS